MKFTAKDVAQLMIDNYNGKVVVPTMEKLLYLQTLQKEK